MKRIVTLRPHMFNSLYTFVSEVRRQMRLLDIDYSRICQFDDLATQKDSSPVQEALKHVEIEIRG